MADRLSMTPSQVSRIISGDRGTTLENLIKIADILKVTRGYFLLVAAGLSPETGKDPWVEDVSQRLAFVPEEWRGFFEDMVDAAIKREESISPNTKPKPKSARS